MMERMDTRLLKPMKPADTGFSQAFLQQVEADYQRRRPSVIRCGTTTTGAPILRCLLSAVRNRWNGEIRSLSARILDCPQCHREHSHTIGVDASGMLSTQKDAQGNRKLVLLTGPCGLKYCLKAYDGEWAAINKQLAAQAAILKQQAEERQQARIAVQRLMQQQASR